MKKLMISLLLGVSVFSFAACGKEAPKKSENAETTATETPSPESTENAEEEKETKTTEETKEAEEPAIGAEPLAVTESVEIELGEDEVGVIR